MFTYCVSPRHPVFVFSVWDFWFGHLPGKLRPLLPRRENWNINSEHPTRSADIVGQSDFCWCVIIVLGQHPSCLSSFLRFKNYSLTSSKNLPLICVIEKALFILSSLCHISPLFIHNWDGIWSTRTTYGLMPLACLYISTPIFKPLRYSCETLDWWMTLQWPLNDSWMTPKWPLSKTTLDSFEDL